MKKIVLLFMVFCVSSGFVDMYPASESNTTQQRKSTDRTKFTAKLQAAHHAIKQKIWEMLTGAKNRSIQGYHYVREHGISQSVKNLFTAMIAKGNSLWRSKNALPTTQSTLMTNTPVPATEAQPAAAAAAASATKPQLQLDQLTNENFKSRVTQQNEKHLLPIDEIKEFLQHLNQDNSDFIVLSLGTGYIKNQIIPSYLQDLAKEYPDKNFINYAIDPKFFTSKYVDEKDQQDENELLESLQQISSSNNIYKYRDLDNLKIALFSTFLPELNDDTQELTLFFKILRSILKNKLRRGCIIFFHVWYTPCNPCNNNSGLMLTYEHLRSKVPAQKSNLRFFVGRQTVWDPEDTPHGLELYDPIQFNFQLSYADNIMYSLSKSKDIQQQQWTAIENAINKTKNVKFCYRIDKVLIDEKQWKMNGIQSAANINTRDVCALYTGKLNESIRNNQETSLRSIDQELSKRGKMLQDTTHGFKIVDSPPSDE